MRTISLLQPQQLTFGSGCLEDCVRYVTSLLERKVHIVSSRSLRNVVEQLSSKLRGSGFVVSHDFSIDREPTVEMFQASLKRLDTPEGTCFLGIGGGSVLDVAKLLAALAGSSQKVEETFGIGLLQGRRSHLICVPTTAGTGSEVSPNAILLDDAAKLKKGVISPFLVPDAVFIDPVLTRTVPPAVTAATGLDTLTHCIEAYTNKFAHPVVDVFALEGIRLCASYLLRAVRNGEDLEAREGMSRASLYGGLCLGPVNTAAVHAMAYPLGGEFHLAHGVSNAILLAPVFRFNTEGSIERHATVGVALGVKSTKNEVEAATEAADRLERLVMECGVSTNLEDYGISPASVPQMAASAVTVTRLLRNNPREIGLGEIEQLYRKCFSSLS
jgi:alcohol dehydrogenase class IV